MNTILLMYPFKRNVNCAVVPATHNLYLKKNKDYCGPQYKYNQNMLVLFLVFKANENLGHNGIYSSR